MRAKAIRHALPRAIEHGANLIAADDVAVRDGDVFRETRFAKREGTLGTDGIVERGIHGAVGDAHIAAAVDVHAIAVGVDLEVIDGQIINAGGENGEPSAEEDREVPEEDVMTVL